MHEAESSKREAGVKTGSVHRAPITANLDDILRTKSHRKPFKGLCKAIWCMGAGRVLEFVFVKVTQLQGRE